MNESDFPPDFLAFLATIKGKRSRVVIDHIIEHGFITTEELETEYHYSHPPRAIRDVREQGVPIETFQVKNMQGRTIAAYRFGDPVSIQPHKAGGRRGRLRKIKTQLIQEHGARCFLCSATFNPDDLQVDHRIPYEVGGDRASLEEQTAYMLVCRPCNRAKPWACEHCKNWSGPQEVSVCETCYWAHPDHYAHIAMQPIRRLELVWSGNEVATFDVLKQQAESHRLSLTEYIHKLLRRSSDESIR